MKYAIVVSKKDPAGMNIKQQLLSHFPFIEDGVYEGEAVYRSGSVRLYTIANFCIYAEYIDKSIDADRFIFATTHKSKENTPSFCVHAPGNWHTADLGGVRRKLNVPMPEEMKCALAALHSLNDIGYVVSMEATHHGPLMDAPVLFIEIGSTMEEWTSAKAGYIVASTLMRVFDTMCEKDGDGGSSSQRAFVIGGTHYNRVANKLMSESAYCVGHICPKHSLEFLDTEQLLWCMKHHDIAVLDWKGLGPLKNTVVELLTECNVSFKKYKDLK